MDIAKCLVDTTLYWIYKFKSFNPSIQKVITTIGCIKNAKILGSIDLIEVACDIKHSLGLYRGW